METTADQTAIQPTDTAAPAPAVADPAHLKQLLNLPETATDLELITVMSAVIAELVQKYDGLRADYDAIQQMQANRFLADNADLIPNSVLPTWKDLFLLNRELAVETITKIRQGRQLPTQPTPAPTSLRNRLADQPRMIHDFTSGQTPDSRRAEALRNRAHELRKQLKIAWADAFARAEKEIQ